MNWKKRRMRKKRKRKVFGKPSLLFLKGCTCKYTWNFL
jgi:hypothetical protein